MRVAAIDIGTNSTRLLVAEVNEGGVRRLHTGLVTTRVGEGMGKGSYLQPQAMARTLAALRGFRREAASHGAEKVIVAATSAVREAANRQDFVAMVAKETGWQVRVLPGEEEARYSYRGVVYSFGTQARGGAVVDIGGGSTEFIWPAPRGGMAVRSVAAGAVRMTEGGHDDAAIAALLHPILMEVRRGGPRRLFGVGGTVTTLAAMVQGLHTYDPGRVHGFTLQREDAAAWLTKLTGMSLAERRQLPGLQPERADIICAGVRILLAVLKGLDVAAITVSEADILDGLALEAAGVIVERKKGPISQR